MEVCLVFAVFVSHPLTDIIFHDAYILFGNRSVRCMDRVCAALKYISRLRVQVTRLSLGLWRSIGWSFALFLLEPLSVYVLFRRWVELTRLVDETPSTLKEWVKWSRLYWALEIFFCNLSWYIILRPVIN